MKIMRSNPVVISYNTNNLLKMLRLIFCLPILFALIIFSTCNNDEKIKGLKPNQILVVTLEIADDIEVRKVTLTSSDGIDSISGNQIRNKKIKLKAPQSGEGLFSVCIFTATDSICSQKTYIEGGYRPKLRFKNNKFESINLF